MDRQKNDKPSCLLSSFSNAFSKLSLCVGVNRVGPRPAYARETPSNPGIGISQAGMDLWLFG